MDVLRGASIVLVVFNHALLFASSSSVGAPVWAWAVNELFAPVRMPLMVFLSGLLVAPSLRRGTRRYLVGKARWVLWPYAVWSLFALALLYGWGIRDGLVGGAVGSVSPTPWAAVQVLYDPPEHLWFLYDLFLFYVIVWATARVSPLWIAVVAIAATALVEDFSARRFCLLLAFFCVGVWFSRHPGLLDRVLAPRWVGWVSLGLALGAVVGVFLGGGLRYHVLSAPIAAGAIVVAILLARRVAGARVLAPLRFVGRDSLVFYIVHWWAVSAGVALGARTGSDLVALGVGIVLGLAVPTGVVWLIRVFPPVNWLFSAPQRRVVPVESRSRDSF